MAEEQVAAAGSVEGTPPATSGATTSGTEHASGDASATQTFTKLDPTTLDPKLQEVYKGLQADYTRKTQEVAEHRRAFEAEREAWLAQTASQSPPPGPQAPGEPSLADQVDATVRAYVESYVQDHVRHALLPHRVEAAEHQIQALKHKYGETFTRNMERTRQILLKTKGASGQPTISLEEAFKAAAADELAEAAKAQTYKELQAKSATTSVRPGVTQSPSSAAAGSFREAFDRAKQKLATR